jgi:RNA-directed DNA polymerase
MTVSPPCSPIPQPVTEKVDFRFTCISWSEVVRSLEVLEEESRLLGLTVNDSKTLTWSRSKYESHLYEVEKLRAEIAEEAELDLTGFDTDTYSGAVVVTTTPDTDEVELLSAFRVIDRWQLAAGRGRVAPRNRTEHRAIVELLPFALSTLHGQPGTPTDVLNQCMLLLRYERTMTPAVATYLTSRQDEQDVLAAFDKLLRSKSYLNGWQAWWLQQPLARVVGFANGDGAPRRLRWARAVLVSAESTPVLRAEAARTLARHGRIGLGELLAIYDRSSRCSSGGRGPLAIHLGW